MAERGLAVPPALRAILFDPLGYLHPRRLRLPPALIGPGQRAAVNDLLIAGYRLDTDWPATASLDAGPWLRHWRRLPQIAYLMGCHAKRAALGWQGGLLRLPDWARPFAALPLPSDAAAPGAPLSHLCLLRAGYGQLLAWGGDMPPALRQRLPLLFPPELDVEAAAATVPDPLLLTLAIQYAQRHPHTPPAGSL
ncbi:type III secretion apparatus protein OrgA/MxiK [Chromobacterium sp. ATCC 53434]|uniref:type III secretion apparatus protein OrgA/MxiK n=1 Tax=Chromobacterium sp. (strain ATCC 53434 / SC 14030) TaxID=2059672 RepID=UPI000C75EC52|nr:type III secretion apparatus protein OrgA/MxiK [Chromobacterium sp. ATCC 53434]AUH51349.1 type III secretion apparatus protein OrgA/MxiK [Chromobacterium sp. ATCC 53434]